MRTHLDRTICSNLSLARRKEWLETNGIGGFASSTIVGMNTRRFHGLLVAATKPPIGRMVLLSKFEETLWIADRPYELSTNQYPGTIYPQGYSWQIEFRLDPLPTFVYEVEGVLLEKTVFMLQEENSTAVQYRLRNRSPEGVRLTLRPLIAFRDYHSLTHSNPALDPCLRTGDTWIALTPYSGLPSLYFNHSGGEVLPGDGWYYRFEYEEERQRGLDWREDLFNPFALHFDLTRTDVCLIASTEIRDPEKIEDHKSGEIRRRTNLEHGWEGSDELVKTLLHAANQFIVRRDPDLRTIIAGYHWFTDWGRDTMISLPGLTLIPGRYEDAEKILLAFARHCDRGMLPNRFPDSGGDPEYYTVDATLWFFQAVYALTKHTDEYPFVREHLYETLKDIIRWHTQGTRHNIKVDEDGLLASGEPGIQLTWMDAKVGDWVVTPRMGKPVEIQALWYNALRVVEHFARQFEDFETEHHHAYLATLAHTNFNEKFWNSEARCLFDCIDGERRDASIRPNQILAVSLPFSMLSEGRMRQVVEVVTQELLTPVGLRSLSPKDSRYRGRYEGDSSHRDAAYHQGTVWTWLLGPYITALVRTLGGDDSVREKIRPLLRGMREHMSDAGLGSISEIFDGDPPHAPKGCISQAWSVAEILRAAVEDLGC